MAVTLDEKDFAEEKESKRFSGEEKEYLGESDGKIKHLFMNFFLKNKASLVSPVLYIKLEV